MCRHTHTVCHTLFLCDYELFVGSGNVNITWKISYNFGGYNQYFATNIERG